jgi:hypothetical protein
MYTAVVLDVDSVERLKNAMNIPEGWETICHHMTINMGEFEDGPAAGVFRLGDEVEMTVHSVASNDKVMAVGVRCQVASKNSIKHVTVAVNRAAGGKPFQSNNLIDWKTIEPFTLKGQIEECT